MVADLDAVIILEEEVWKLSVKGRRWSWNWNCCSIIWNCRSICMEDHDGIGGSRSAMLVLVHIDNM